VELPHPAQIISTAKPEAGGGEPAQASSQASTTSPASPRLIKFRGKDGRAGILEWNAERISYSGDMEPEASAKACMTRLLGKIIWLREWKAFIAERHVHSSSTAVAFQV